MKAAGLLVAALVLGLAMACTVDEVVGSNVDAGTAICSGTGSTCDPVCGAQLCRAGCSELSDCVTSCSGTSCSFSCERSGQTCSPTCDPGPCQLSCVPNGELVDCTVSCNPLQSCAVDCRGGQCTVACGDLKPATTCDAGVYSCSGSCPL